MNEELSGGEDVVQKWIEIENRQKIVKNTFEVG